MRASMRRGRGRLLRMVLLVAVPMTLMAGCGKNTTVIEARRLIGSGDRDGALVKLQSAARENPGDEKVLFMLVATASTLGRDEVVIEALDMADDLGGKKRNRSRKIRHDLWLERYQPAWALLDSVERADRDDLLRALEQVRQSKRIEPWNAACPAAEGELLLRTGRSEPADSSFNRAIELTPADSRSAGHVVTSLLRSADYKVGLGDLRSATRLARSAHQLQPEDARTLYALGVHLHRFGRAEADTTIFREAAVTFHGVLEKIPDDSDARYNLALTLYRLGDIETAEEEIRRLLRDDPLRPHGYRLLARIAIDTERRDLARGATVAKRALEGEEVPVPETALGVGKIAGHIGRKHFVLDRPPDRIHRYTESRGVPIEVWFFTDGPSIRAYAEERVIVGLDLSGGDGDQR